MKTAETKAENIRRLQKQILSMQGQTQVSTDETISTGLTSIEQSFPNHTFPTGAIHEFISHAPIDGAATSGFLAGLVSCLAQTKDICLWISTRRNPMMFDLLVLKTIRQ